MRSNSFEACASAIKSFACLVRLPISRTEKAYNARTLSSLTLVNCDPHHASSHDHRLQLVRVALAR